MTKSKLQTLYQVIGAVFCTLVVLANILSAKMVSFPWFGLSIPAGLFFYPLTFLCNDLVTEVFGAKKAKTMVYIALGMSLFSFGMIQISLALPSYDKREELMFQNVLGCSSLRIFSSLVSYTVSQIAAIHFYTAIRGWTGPAWLWLRNNGSTGLSQIIDTILIDLLFLWWGLGMSMVQVMPIMFFSYVYKLVFSAACTPFFYFFVFLVRRRQREPIFHTPIQTQGSPL
jgi:uncharacterized integral membrane protein (TIGR00697 family)